MKYSLDKILDTNNFIFWDVKSTKLNDLAYKLYLINNYNLNQRLFEENQDKRSSYTTYKNFLKLKDKSEHYMGFVKEAKVLIRKDKINKIIK